MNEEKYNEYVKIFTDGKKEMIGIELLEEVKKLLVFSKILMI